MKGQLMHGCSFCLCIDVKISHTGLLVELWKTSSQGEEVKCNTIVKSMVIILGAAVIDLESCLLLRKDKGK